MGRTTRRTRRKSKAPLLLGGSAIAGLLYYLFDPRQGRGRRERLAAQAESAARGAVEATNAKLDLATDTAMGTVADALPGDTPENDQTLIAKVRSEALGSRWSTINVDACDGVVTLRGELADEDEIGELSDAVSGVTGVEEVENLVHLPGQTPENVRPARRASRHAR